MRPATSIFVCLLLLRATLLHGATTAPATQPSKAAVIVLSGEIDDYNKATLIKNFAEARKLGVDTIILQINTYGGLVTAGLDISQFLKSQNDLHVIAFVDQKAISAGAMIAMACNEIVMQPGSKLGDCAPIATTSSGELQTLGPTERAKLESPILEDFDDSARRNGYDPLLAQSMVSVTRVVHWIQHDDGQRKFVDDNDYKKLTAEGWKPVPDVPDPVDGPDTLFTTGPDLALKLGLAKAIEPTPLALAESRGMTIAGDFTPSAGEAIIGFLSSNVVRGLLTTIFLVALYTSFSHPGHGMAELIAVMSLVVLVGVPLLTGFAQWWQVLAILIGIGLLALEIFVLPGHFVSGIVGIVLVLVGLVMTWVGQEPSSLPGVLPQLQGTWDRLLHGVLIVVGGMFCSLLLWLWLQRYLPKLPYFHRLILTTTSGGPTIGNTTTGEDTVKTGWPPVGAHGRAMTDLRPGGSAAFHDNSIGDSRLTTVTSDMGYILAGAEVIVREVEGQRVVVREVKKN